MDKQKKWLASNWRFEMSSYDISELTTGDDQFNFDFSSVNTGGEAASTSDLDIWEWRKLVEDGLESDEAIFAGEITYIEPNYDDTAADCQHDYMFQNNQTDMEF